MRRVDPPRGFDTMNRLRSGILGLVGVFAAMLVCGCSPDRFVVQGESGATMLSIDAQGAVQIAGPITTEVALESEDLAEHAGRGEFLVRNGNGHTVARVDGRTGSVYLHGQLVHDPELEASALPEFVVTDAAGTAMALIDAYGNLKYRGRIGMVMTRSVSSTEYVPGCTLDVTVTLYYYDTAPIEALGVREQFPEGWIYIEHVSGADADVEPSAGQGPLLPFAWVNPPEGFPISFTYRVRAPQNAEGEALIAGQGLYRTDGPEYRSNMCSTHLSQSSTLDSADGIGAAGDEIDEWQFNAQDGAQVVVNPREELAFQEHGNGDPDSLQAEYCGCAYYSADINKDWHIDLSELLRLVQFFNFGLAGYSCGSGTEDGYMPGPYGGYGCPPHDADYCASYYSDCTYFRGSDWKISLTELLRVIQLFNISYPYGYYDGFHRDTWLGTEDGFALGGPCLLPSPGIDLLGSDAIALEVGSQFADPGYNSWQYRYKLFPAYEIDYDYPLWPCVTLGGDSVDTSRTGIYTIRYNVNDIHCFDAEEMTREVVVASVEILEVDITLDRISVRLMPEGVTGTLTLTLTGAGEHVIGIYERSGGTYVESFNIPSLSKGEYLQMQACWSLYDSDICASSDYHIQVLGEYDHTCYITADEDDCTGTPTDFAHFTGDCVLTPCVRTIEQGKAGWLDAITNRRYGAGSGIDTLGRTIHTQEHFCSGGGYTYRLRETGQLCPSCGNGLAYGNVAISPGSHPQGLTCGDELYVYQHGVHIVADTGDRVNDDQLDHYSPSTGCHDCDAIGDNIMTIKIGCWN